MVQYAVGVEQGVHVSDSEEAATEHGHTFSSFGLQLLYDANRSAVTGSRLDAFITLDQSASGPWAHLSWDTIAHSAGMRVINPAIMQQSVLGVCGVAAALEADAERNAVDYAKLVRDVFSTGVIDGHPLNKILLGNSPPSGMDEVDWMLMSAVQDSSNLVYEYHGDTSKVRQGESSMQEHWILEHIDHCVDVENLSCQWWGEISETEEANKLLAAHGDDVLVVVSCDSGMLANNGTGPIAHAHDHWVRLLAPVDLSNDRAKFSIFTWGQRMNIDWEQSRFKHWVFSYVVGATKNGIL